MKKNCKIHLWLDSELKELVEKQANDEGITVCEFCIRKLKENSRILKIEYNVERIISILENSNIYKQNSIKNSKIGMLGKISVP